MTSQPDALLGALAADALAMPVHWYYDRAAMERDYGKVSTYAAPRNPHPDSILWRSQYEPLNERGDILHEQARYWGQRGVHYHQFLQAGENTLNFQLAARLHAQVREQGRYDADAWLALYLDFMLTPGRHHDTYVEEYHREFFTNYARGRKPRACGVADVHIGGLAPVPALFCALAGTSADVPAAVQEHVALTHKDPGVLRAAGLPGTHPGRRARRRSVARRHPGPRRRLDLRGKGEGVEPGSGRGGSRATPQPGLLHPGRVSRRAVPGVEVRRRFRRGDLRQRPGGRR